MSNQRNNHWRKKARWQHAQVHTQHSVPIILVHCRRRHTITLQVTQLNSPFPTKLIVIKPSNKTGKKNKNNNNNHECQSLSSDFAIYKSRLRLQQIRTQNTSCVSSGCNETSLLETGFLFAWISPLESQQNTGFFTVSIKCWGGPRCHFSQITCSERIKSSDKDMLHTQLWLVTPLTDAQFAFSPVLWKMSFLSFWG